MSAMTAAERVSEFTIGLAARDIPDDVRQDAKLHLLDALGCGLASSALGLGGAARTVAAASGGRPEATVIGLDERLPAVSAALANGTLIHALDFDDTHAASITHPSAVVVPAALAAAERSQASGSDLVAALVVGNEIVARLGSVTAGAFHARGFHPTSVVGVFAAAAAAARLSSLEQATVTNALGIAGSLASGLFAYLSDGTPTKPLHAGWAAHGGLIAAQLAVAGGAGPRSVLEGRFGLYDAFTQTSANENGRLDEELSTLGASWETSRLAYKAFPVCHYMHGVLGAAGSLTVNASEIEEIVVSVPAAAVPLVLEPAAAKLAPRSEYDAKFSLPFSLAALLIDGRLTVSSFTKEKLTAAAIIGLSRRVKYEIEPFATEGAAFPGAIRIRLRDGEVVTARLDHQPGAPQDPVSVDGVLAKFRDNAQLALDAEACSALEAAILSLEEHELSSTLAPLARAERGGGG
jgi:2-methylcitrate dehydratase PrpD